MEGANYILFMRSCGEALKLSLNSTHEREKNKGVWNKKEDRTEQVGEEKKNKTRRRQVCGGRVKIGGIRIAKKTARGGEDEEREKRGGALITHT